MPRLPSRIGRKWLLPFALVALLGGAWWWTLPPRDPVGDGERLSEWFSRGEWQTLDYSFERIWLKRFGPDGVTWLTYKLEHGRRWYDPNRRRLFDRAPDWLRKWVPEGLGGLRGAIDWDERENAAWHLAAFEAEAAPAVPALVRAMEDEDPNLRGYAARALYCIGPAAWPAIDKIWECGSVQARRVLVEQLPPEYVSPSDAELVHMVEIVIKAFHDPDSEVQRFAFNAITSLHASRPEVTAVPSIISELIPLLFNPNDRVRESALQMVFLFGTDAAAIKTRVVGYLDSENPSVRSRAIEVLVRLDMGRMDMNKQESVPRLRMMMLHDPDGGCREAAAEALRRWEVAVDDVSAAEK